MSEIARPSARGSAICSAVRALLQRLTAGHARGVVWHIVNPWCAPHARQVSLKTGPTSGSGARRGLRRGFCRRKDLRARAWDETARAGRPPDHRLPHATHIIHAMGSGFRRRQWSRWVARSLLVHWSRAQTRVSRRFSFASFVRHTNCQVTWPHRRWPMRSVTG